MTWSSTGISLKSRSRSIACGLLIGVTGCAVQTPPVQQRDAPQSQSVQTTAQRTIATQPSATPQLKRKIALGRISNETNYGRSLLRDQQGDPLGKQVTDLLSKALTESGAYLVFERPDISRVIDESRLSNSKLNLVGVDALIIGSLTEFGRKTLGESGFVSSSKRQVAFAKIDLRLVDTTTGHAFFATSGAGEASTETASTFGFGSRAGYDGTLNDAAIRNAISEVVNRLATQIQARPWQTFILRSEGDIVYIGGGVRQGILPGMRFVVMTQGDRIKSAQTGTEITLPGRTVARLKIESNFGDSDLNEGSLASISDGSLQGLDISKLVIRHDGGTR